jgi:hypothetical protein
VQVNAVKPVDSAHLMNMNETTPQTGQTNLTTATGYVDGPKLLELLFDEASRPSLRWLRDQQKARALPFAKIGRLCFFDPILVKAHLDAKAAGRK